MSGTQTGWEQWPTCELSRDEHLHKHVSHLFCEIPCPAPVIASARTIIIFIPKFQPQLLFLHYCNHGDVLFGYVILDTYVQALADVELQTRQSTGTA